jgi:hypothetical protein
MKITRLLKPGASSWLAADRPNWDRIATSAALLVPPKDVWRIFEMAVKSLNVAMCLHRVSATRKSELTISAQELDRFLEKATSLRHEHGQWLTLSFDDGYADAAEYIETRAPRFPQVEWLLMVCPEKAERQAGFRWDLPNEDRHERDVLHENQRPDLHEIATHRESRLATLEECRHLAALPNAHLGNHTNCHFRALDLSFEQSARELRSSHENFRRLFGEVRHFAFPFGMPERDFDARHVEVLRERGDFLIWTTARRPYHPEDRKPGAVLPRFPVIGTWTAEQIAFWMALLTLKWRKHSRQLHYLRSPSGRPPAAGGQAP